MGNMCGEREGGGERESQKCTLRNMNVCKLFAYAKLQLVGVKKQSNSILPFILVQEVSPWLLTS